MQQNFSTYRRYCTVANQVLLCLMLAFTSNVIIAQQTEIQYLSGRGENDMIDWQFYCTAGANSGKWTTIGVPSCWELQGFGKYNYGFAKDSARGMEQGIYKREFNVPTAWRGKVIQLVFEGVMTDALVKINGKVAGAEHQGAYYRFSYDISKLVNYGRQNEVEVTVAKHSKNESVNAAERRGDFWIFGGIFRPVYLKILPQSHIVRSAIDAKAGGLFTANVYLSGISSGASVKAQLFDSKGKPVSAAFTVPVGKADTIVRLQSKFAKPALWTAETPNLYHVEYTLIQEGKPVHTSRERFGFRTIEVRERDGVYVNGVKVKFKGVNRHSFWPESGRTLSRRISLMDAQLIKDMNMNAVRMSHYPGDEHWYDICDSLGIYVLDELAGWHGHYDTAIGTALVKALVRKNGNHPSVVMWANGNEGGHNYALDEVFKAADIQDRHVIHPWEAFAGFDTQHYREYNYGIANYDHGHNIVMPTEFLHGLYDGGHGAGLQDYWEAMWHDPMSAGGFLWDFADQGIVRTDLNDSIDTDKNRGPDGIVGPYRQKEGSYFTIKEVWSPVHMYSKELTPAFDGTMPLQNRYQFTNLSQCEFVWSLKKLDTVHPAVITGNIVAPSVAPGQNGFLKLDLPKDWTNYDVLYLMAFGPDRGHLFTWTYPITRPVPVAKEMLKTNGPGKPSFKEEDSLFLITANNISYRINRNNGLLQEVKNSAGVIPLNNGPVIEEGVNNFSSVIASYDVDTLVVRSLFNRKEHYNTIEWRIYPSGLAKLEVHYFPSAYFIMMAGVNFSFPEKAIEGVTYMGDGPYRVWKNRMKGTMFGIWDKPYNNTETGEQWNYPEFKGYYSNMYWCTFKMSKQSFTVFTPDESLYLRLFTPAWKTDQWHNYEPTFPSGDISFMQGISSIGTKTQRNETTGPMGQKYAFYDYEKDPNRWLTINLYFDFSTRD